MNPLISVVIPVYNRRESLVHAIESVINQTYTNIEILIVDDGSEINLKPATEQFNDIRIIYTKLDHTNANVARNYGIKHSKGEYIAMLDADDIWLKNHLEDCLSTIRVTNSDGLYGSLTVKNKIINNEKNVIARHLKKGESMIDYLLVTGCGAQTSTLFMTAKSAKKISWNPELKRHQDYDFVVEYSKQFSIEPKKSSTVIHIPNSSNNTIDFESCIKVIKKNITDIKPLIYNEYNLSMYMLAKRMKASENILKYYRKESTRYKEYISYVNYFAIRLPETRIKKWKRKLEYLWYILNLDID
jgi:glycosyltransferase involved in cell wall biosynthesis